MNPIHPSRVLRWIALRASLSAAAVATLGAGAAHAQLYMPRAVKQAYAAGTRTPSGRPGAAYWQNRARYAITVTAAPPARTVTGTERITYYNNSPDTLASLQIRLFMNIHKPGAPRAGGAGEAYLTSGVHVDTFAVNGSAVEWKESEGTFTNRAVKLPAPLLPHDSVRLAFAWHYDASRESGREGMLDSTTMFLAYFYPRVAVYDDYNGWDTSEFNDRQEFYSDFNDYDVTLRVPSRYVVWGTGTLLNPEAVLQPAVLERYRQSMASDAVVHVATGEETTAGRATRGSGMNEWRFRSAHIPDVTFALSDHYDWDGTSVVVDDAAGRRASVQSAYSRRAPDFRYMAGFGRHALDWFSHHWPGVPYPYEKTTVVEGTADMEYPMMVNDSPQEDTTFSRFVAEHEIAHTWFPFYMGINETRYAFMDEGWATTLEYLVGQSDTGPDRAAEFFRAFRVRRWINDPSPAEDLPIVTPADVLGGSAYGNNAYGKAALGYLAVKDMLGDEVFGRALHEYMARWNGKHPIPWDFFNTFNDATGRNLDWFWSNWYFSNGYIDLAVASVDRPAGGYAVRVRNVGGFAAPFDLRLRFRDGSSQTLHQTAAVWERDQAQTTISVPSTKELASVDIDGGIWMDANPADNHWPGLR
jgi:hypothetical protein